MRLVILQSLDWIKENAFTDELGDYWENEDEYKKWQYPNVAAVLKYIPSEIYSEIFNFESFDELWRRDISWCIIKEITEDKNPEYFL